MLFYFGIPNESIIKRLKEANIKLIGTATSVDEAIANEKAGMDAIVAQGSGSRWTSWFILKPKINYLWLEQYL